ncbi:hypothetical protein WA026_015073 [Henosepilachna vigintioctopunctata]|uniref:Uncharacterized protein n=1 Tax=Henosepilachna vigintioctopunctata TaxID=420089 RepID=A0AAW1TZ44_9CUCU
MTTIHLNQVIYRKMTQQLGYACTTTVEQRIFSYNQWRHQRRSNLGSVPEYAPLRFYLEFYDGNIKRYNLQKSI